jgi:Xaa-Pro aminopeptidase
MIPSAELRRRLRRVQDALHEKRVNVLFLGKGEDVYYLSGASTGRIIVTPWEAVLWIKEPYDRLYSRLYESRGYPLDVRQYKKDSLKDFLRGRRLRKISVDDISLDYARHLEKRLGKKAEYSDVLEDVRAVKTRYGVECLKKSCRIAKAGMRKASDVVHEGVRELDAVAEIEAELRRRGSGKAPFGSGMLLASGRRSADIHANASLKGISRGLVVVDLGAVYEGYHSDMTRTFAVKPSLEEREVVEFVGKVQEECIGMLKPGLGNAEVYRFVETEFKKKGFRPYHLPGHGVGLEVHEKPSLTPDSRESLRRNMVFTIEPGVYVPGKYGVRFEDTVLLDGKARVLT